MTETLDVTPTPKALTVRQEKFLAVYLQTGNATEAARQAGYSAKRLDQAGYETLRNPEVAAELARRKSDIASAIGLKLVDIFKRLKDQAFTNIGDVMDNPKALTPEQQSALLKYDAGGPQSSEKWTMHDQPKLLLELNDRLFPPLIPPPVAAPTTVTNVQVNIDKLMLALGTKADK